jgi:uroporphyrin-III C-methyltransferase/precorrin-2 dehydrogenase/sirohydrochlorin ferrochelatase
LADALAAARERLRMRWPEADGRRAAIDAALSPGGMLDPALPQDEPAVERWLAAGKPTEPAARIERIVLHSSDPDDLTLREARLLASAERIYHRADVPSAILDRARADAERIPCEAAPLELGPGLSLDIGA